MEVINGYELTGNHAAIGREYRVCRADGEVVAVSHVGKGDAIAIAERLPTGDITVAPEPVVEPTPAPVSPPVKKLEKKAAKKKATKRKAR